MLPENRNPVGYGAGDSAVYEQHSGACTVVLHLLPGALITAFYVGAAPVVRSLGFPSLMSIAVPNRSHNLGLSHHANLGRVHR
jgi:hypothetical protein